MSVRLSALRESADHMRNRIILALSWTRSKRDLFPRAGLQEPLVGRPCDIAAIEKVRPHDVDEACVRSSAEPHDAA